MWAGVLTWFRWWLIISWFCCSWGRAPVFILLLAGASDTAEGGEEGAGAGPGAGAAAAPAAPTPSRPFIMAYWPRICCCHIDIAWSPLTGIIKQLKQHS